MIKLLLFILIPILLLALLGYWRYGVSKSNLTTSQSEKVEGPIEVPKTLPEASLEDRVKDLEKIVIKLVNQYNNQKSSPSPTASTISTPSNLEGAVTELKARVSALENAATPAPASSTSSKYPLYIPLGSTGGPWGNQDWNTINEYEASIDSSSYAGYSSMQLEVNFRLVEAAGTGSVRLFNTTDNTAISSQVDTTSTTFGLKISSTFTLPSGAKTYKIQVKSSQGKDLYLQSARIKVNF